MTIWNRLDAWDKKMISGLIVAMLICWGILFFRTPKPYVPPPAAAPVVISMPVTVDQPTSTSWAKCVDFSGRPIDKKNYEIILQNHCGIRLDEFTVLFKFYDTTENRIGWANQGVSPLEVGERVRWRDQYPVKDYPLTAEGVGSIKVSTYGGKEEKQ